MNCFNSFHAEQGSMLNLGPGGPELGSGEFRVRLMAAGP